VPEALDGALGDPGALLGELREKVPLIAAFFLGCFVIGAYWWANHRFVSRLAAVDSRYILLTVLYLTFVALLPFPTGLVGEFPTNDLHGILRDQHGRGQHDGGGALRSRVASAPPARGNATRGVCLDVADVAIAGAALHPLHSSGQYA
jgi:hypothetical protein